MSKPILTQSIKQRQTAVGYCHSGNRPACSNCGHLLNPSHPKICAVGNFEPTHSGWCPHWNPCRDWAEAYPHVLNLIKTIKWPSL